MATSTKRGHLSESVGESGLSSTSESTTYLFHFSNDFSEFRVPVNSVLASSYVRNCPNLGTCSFEQNHIFSFPLLR